MDVHTGDRLVVEGRKVGQGRRCGEITRIEGSPVHQRLWVRWDDGRETMLFPGPGVHVERSKAAKKPKKKAAG